MFNFDIDFAKLIFPSVIMLVGCFFFMLLSLASIISQKISLKSTLKATFREWMDERKYFLSFYLYTNIIMIAVIFLMLFGLFAMFAAIPVLALASGIIINVKNKDDYYTEELTSYRCQCGQNVTQIIKINNSGEQKILYYICRNCQKRYSEDELENK